MGTVRNTMQVVRLPFLVLTPSSVLLGLAAAVADSADCSPWLAALALTGAVSAHISVNAFNEHHDFTSGLDLTTVRTPFSGGSGALPAHPEFARAAQWIAHLALLATIVIGIYFVLLRGYLLLPLGALGILVVLSYTPLLTRHALLCLVAPGLGFGPLMVLGTCIALTGQFSATAAALSLVPFFLVSNLLLLNQFPDVAADRRAGRCNLPILIGPHRSLIVYALFVAFAAGAVVAGTLAGILPSASLATLLVLPAGCYVVLRAWRYSNDAPNLVPALALNVAIAVVTPVLLSVSLLFA